jgi:hypothetical protein
MALRARYRIIIDAHLLHGAKVFCGMVTSMPSNQTWPNLMTYVRGVEPSGVPGFLSQYTKQGADKAALLLSVKYPEYIGRITIERIRKRPCGS